MNSFLVNVKNIGAVGGMTALILLGAAYVSHNRGVARSLPQGTSLTGMEEAFVPVELPVQQDILPQTESAVVSQPFEEMTIPFLRTREYESSLTNLKQYAEHATYISYLTSFDSDGLKVNGLLTIPKGKAPEGGWPALVFVHGYIPPSQYKTTGNYVAYVDYLARQKMVVFKIDLRGHGDSEGEPSGAYYSSDYVIDTLNAYAALESASFVNAERIGLWGHSMSGNVTLRAFTARPDIPAVVIWAGAGYTYTDLREYGIDDNSYRPLPQDTEAAKHRVALREQYGEFSETSDFWKQVTPSNYLADLQGALQLHHAVDDTVVSINYSRNLNRLLDETTIVHEINEYPVGGHNINSTSFSKAMSNTAAFLKQHLEASGTII